MTQPPVFGKAARFSAGERIQSELFGEACTFLSILYDENDMASVCFGRSVVLLFRAIPE